jgi:N12 class adenine-specific DNA methylase
MIENSSITLPATVEKLIKPMTPGDPEKAQIAIEGADHLYREIRIENMLIDENGGKVRLKQGAEVEVTVEAPPAANSRVVCRHLRRYSKFQN